MHDPALFTGWLRRSRLLPDAEFAEMQAGAEVLERDAHGIKVLRLSNGDILKTFRVKHLVSRARFYSHARSFCRNAERLRAIGIPTVAIKQLYHFAAPGRAAVLYRPLPGRTLRQIAHAEGLDGHLEPLGAFIAGLHRRGVLFRSLHLGNIVQTPDAKLGLIDVADLGILPWRLRDGQRLRNFRHLGRLAEDRRLLGAQGWRVLCGAYADAAGFSGARRQRFLQRVWCIYEHGRA